MRARSSTAGMTTAPRGVRVALSVLLSALAACAYAGCYGPTQIELRISSDAPCDGVAAAGGVEVTLSSSADAIGEERPSATAAGCVGPADVGTGSSLGTLVLVPSAGRNERVIVQAVLRLPERATPCRPPLDVAGCIVARRSVRFIEHASLRMPITLDLRCKGVACGGDQTCTAGLCVVADVGDCAGDCAPGVTGNDAGLPPVGEAGPGPDDGSVHLGTDASVTPHDAGATTDASDGGCPPRVPHKCAACGSQRCCVTPGGGTACGDQCVTQGSDQPCTDTCQCLSPAVCKLGSCGGLRFCGGNCDPIQ